MKWTSRDASDVEVRVRVLARAPDAANLMKNRKAKLKKQSLLLITGLVFLFLFSASQVSAGCGEFSDGLVNCSGPDCSFCSLFELIHNVLDFILTCIAPILVVLMVVIGGLFLLVSRGNPGLFDRAKSTLTGAVMGIALIFAGWILVNTFLDYMGYVEWNAWNDSTWICTGEEVPE